MSEYGKWWNNSDAITEEEYTHYMAAKRILINTAFNISDRENASITVADASTIKTLNADYTIKLSIEVIREEK